MVQTLYSNGANSIWEHSLLDPASVMSGKRKANPQDKLQWVFSSESVVRCCLNFKDLIKARGSPSVDSCRLLVHGLFPILFLMSYVSNSPNKSQFIRAKYQMLAFVHRMPCREDDSSTAKDLSKVRRRTAARRVYAKPETCFYANLCPALTSYCHIYFSATSLERTHR